MRTKQATKRPIPRLIILGLTALLLGGPLAFAAGNTPAQPATLEPRTITAEMTCAACGMYPERFPQWQSQVVFADGTMAAFDGCKCMFRFLLNLQQFAPERQPGQIAAVWVKDFKTGLWLDGKEAHYVIGSKEMGPMGKELIPFATEVSAKEFQAANGGTMETYANIAMATLKSLMGGMQHMQMNMPHQPKH